MMVTNSEDLLREILRRLPAKSLIRFKIVCKLWLSLISDHHFSHLHTLHNRSRYRSQREPALLLRLAESSDYFYLQNKKWVPYHISPALTEPTILSFSNGLFLLHCGDFKNHPMEDCHIYNPTTKQSRKILLSASDEDGCVVWLNLAFDPLQSPHYKIVCVKVIRWRKLSRLGWSWRTRCQIEVYDSESGTWKLCGKPFSASQETRFDNGIYWKGRIHWRGTFFDLRENVVRRHPGVEVSGDTRTEIFSDNYVESNGHLHYIAHFGEEKSLMVFELQSDYSEWSLKYHIDLDTALGRVSMLSIIRGESEEDNTLVLDEPGKIMAYKLQEKSVEELMDFRGEAFYKEGCVQFASQSTFPFIETLAPV